MALDKTLYTAHATTTGGRAEGKSRSSDGNLDVTLNPPKELGGSSKGTNPEQLFAAGYSACFMGALKHVAKEKKVSIPADASIEADVGFGPLAGGKPGFGIEVAMRVSLPGIERAKAQELVDAAHVVCPYSNATRGNVDVKLSVV